MSSLETRLRERIDTLTDQRDKAEAVAEERRVKLLRVQRQLRETRASRDFWRTLHRAAAKTPRLHAKWTRAAGELPAKRERAA